MAQTTDRVIVTENDGIVEVRFNRPDKRNALDQAQFHAIAEAGEALLDSSARVVILTGEGESFCAGLDFAMFGKMADGSNGDQPPGSNLGDLTERGITHLAQQVCWIWQELPMPVIAAVRGHALGGGAQIALGADIRISRPDAQWAIRELHWGITPDMTATLTLSRLVRPDIAKELVFTARVIDGKTAHDYGMVTHLADDPNAAARELAAEIAGRNPAGVRGAKQLINAQANAGAAEQFALERDTIEALIGTPNQVEAIMSNMEKRPPQFTD